MNAIPHHLNDEHLQFYEWHGAGIGMQHAVPARSKRSHPWHASNAVLALLTSLLIVNGYDSKDPAEKPDERIERAQPDPRQGAGTLNSERDRAQAGEANRNS